MENKTKTRRVGKLKGSKYLPMELWREVFARLPVKTLLRFRSVCKLWCSLIDAHDFTSLHRRIYNCGKYRFIVQEDSKSRCRFTLRRTDTFRKTAQLLETTTKCTFFGNSDGLVLLVSGYNPKTEVRIWNPSIRKCLILPSCPLLCSTSGVYCIGVSNMINDYKIFYLQYFCPPVSTCLSYKLSDNQWTRKKIPWKFQSTLRREALVQRSPPHMTQCVAHWMIRDQDLCPQGYKFTHCLSFDIVLEQFYVVKLPETGIETLLRFFTLGESLALFEFSSLNWRIWVMVNDGDEMLWNQKYSGSFPSHAYQSFRGYIVSDQITFEESSGTIFLLSPYGRRKGLVSYNLKTGHIKHLGKSVRHFLPHLVAHVESLVLFRGPQSPKPNAYDFSMKQDCSDLVKSSQN